MVTKRLLNAPELFALRITLATVALDLALVFLRGARLDPIGYGKIVLLAGMLLAVGFAYRRSGRSDSIGTTCLCTGLFILFSAAMSLFNHMLVPNGRPVIDEWLIRADAVLGYDWPSIIAWAAEYPLWNEVLRLTYLATLPQIAILVIVLGLTGRIRDLHSLLTTVVIAATGAVLFWGLFPSAGAKAFQEVPPALLEAVRPIVDPPYGAAIIDLIHNGTSHLSPDEFRGLIAFPSFHIVLGFVATFHARSVKWLLVPYAALNVLLLPAVLVHGGHHLLDIPAGIAVFMLALAASRAVSRPATAAAFARA